MGPWHHPLAGLLTSGLTQLGLDLSRQQQEALIEYLLLLNKWNSAYNLSGIKEVEIMVGYHLLDSLAIASYIDGEVILDVGTGAGLPGIPLAVCYPRKQFLLLDSNGKKTRFLFQVKTALGLDNVTIVHERAEHFQSRQQIDIVLSRAFASLSGFIAQVRHLVNEHTRLLAMKGRYPEDELADLPESFFVGGAYALSVPGVRGLRHLIEIRQVPED